MAFFHPFGGLLYDHYFKWIKMIYSKRPDFSNLLNRDIIFQKD